MEERILELENKLLLSKRLIRNFILFKNNRATSLRNNSYIKLKEIEDFINSKI